MLKKTADGRLQNPLLLPSLGKYTVLPLRRIPTAADIAVGSCRKSASRAARFGAGMRVWVKLMGLLSSPSTWPAGLPSIWIGPDCIRATAAQDGCGGDYRCAVIVVSSREFRSRIIVRHPPAFLAPDVEIGGFLVGWKGLAAL